MRDKIQTFIVNLPCRNDRRTSVLNEFHLKDEFSTHLIEGKKSTNGSLGLWETIIQIVDIAIESKLEYFLLCEDDHIFTENYSSIDIFTIIDNAKKNGVELLLGGVSWLVTALKIDSNLFQIEKFHGLNFCIIFKRVFLKIKEYNFRDVDSADIVLSGLTSKKLLIYPFISIQKEFGYSDITTQNAEPGKVTKLFCQSADVVRFLLNQSCELKRNCREWRQPANWPNFPVYIYDEHESNKLFNNMVMKRNALDYRNIPIKITQSRMSPWGRFKAIIEESLSEEFIIICNSTHKFTADYNKENLKKLIKQAYINNIEIISGGDFDDNRHIIPITKELFWVDSFSSSQFLIIFKNAFFKILQSEVDFKRISDGIASVNLTSCMAFPFISTIDNEHSTGSYLNRNFKDFAIQSFKKSSDRFAFLSSQFFGFLI